MKLEKTFLPILFLKADNVARLPTFFDNLDYKNGPRYLIECLLYFTVLNLGIKKSEFRKLSLDNDTLRIAISCRRLL